MNVTWQTCIGGVWCNLESLNTSTLGTVRGVYIIWQAPSGSVVYVGQGWIADRLQNHRADPDILASRGAGSLLVTWAEIADETELSAVERFLINHYQPLLSKRSPIAVVPVSVNLPT